MLDISKLVPVKTEVQADRPKSAVKGKTVIRAGGKGTIIKINKKPEKVEKEPESPSEDILAEEINEAFIE